MFGFFKSNAHRQKEASDHLNKALQARVDELQSDLDLTDGAYRLMIEDQHRSNGEIEKLKERIIQRDEMLKICRDSRLDAEKDAKASKDALIIATFKLNSATDAIKIFAERYNISAAELRQLQVADTLTPDEGNQGFEKPSAAFAPFEATDPLILLNAGNDFKQTSGKFRQLRQNFVTLQLALTKMFDGLERQAKKNPVTIDQLRDVRQQASDAIGRKI